MTDLFTGYGGVLIAEIKKIIPKLKVFIGVRLVFEYRYMRDIEIVR